MIKRALISIPNPLLEVLDKLAKQQYRSRSEMVRQVVREYIEAKEEKANAQ